MPRPDDGTAAPRLVVITNGNFFAQNVLQDLFRAHAAHIDRVVLIAGDYNGRTGWRALRALAKKTAFPYLVYKVISVLAFSAAGAIWRRIPFTVERLARAYGVPVHRFLSIRDPEAIRCVAEARADLVISASCPQRIGQEILSTARCGGINTHASLLPRYGGLAPYFWVLAEGERQTGTTVHYMTDRFDEGAILGQVTVDIEPGESSFRLFYRLGLLCGPLLLDATNAALAGDRGRPQELRETTYRSHPSMAAYRELRRRGHRLARLGEIVGVVASTLRRERSK